MDRATRKNTKFLMQGIYCVHRGKKGKKCTVDDFAICRAGHLRYK
jgi:hypothetical protein